MAEKRLGFDFDATGDLSKEIGKINTGLQTMGRRMDATGGRATRFAQSLDRGFSRAGKAIGIGLVGAATAGAVAIGALLRRHAKLGDELAKTSRRTGISVDVLSRYDFAAKISGASTSDLATGLQRLARSAFDAQSGLSTPLRALEKIHLTAEDIAGPDGSLLPLDEILLKVADGVAGLSSQGDQLAVTLSLLGRGGASLLPFLQGGSQSIRELAAESDRLQITWSALAAQEAEELVDAATRLSGAFDAIGRRALTTFGPVVTNAMNSIARDVLPAVGARLDEIFTTERIERWSTVARAAMLDLPRFAREAIDRIQIKLREFATSPEVTAIATILGGVRGLALGARLGGGTGGLIGAVAGSLAGGVGTFAFGQRLESGRRERLEDVRFSVETGAFDALAFAEENSVARIRDLIALEGTSSATSRALTDALIEARRLLGLVGTDIVPTEGGGAVVATDLRRGGTSPVLDPTFFLPRRPATPPEPGPSRIPEIATAVAGILSSLGAGTGNRGLDFLGSAAGTGASIAALTASGVGAPLAAALAVPTLISGVIGLFTRNQEKQIDHLETIARNTDDQRNILQRLINAPADFTAFSPGAAQYAGVSDRAFTEFGR